MKTRTLLILLTLFSFISCGQQERSKNPKANEAHVANPHKVEDSAKMIIERANQNIKDSLKQ